MALLSKKTPAIFVPVQAGVEPPFGYVRDFYAELAAAPRMDALYDISSDFVETDVTGGILSVRDSLGKKSTPLSLVPGATPPLYTDMGGGGADCSVGTDAAACILQGADYTGATAYGICAIYSFTTPTGTNTIASFGAGSNNFWADAGPKTFKLANLSPTSAGAYLDGKPEWGLGYRQAGASKVVTERGSATGTQALAAPSRLYVGSNNATLAFGNRWKGIIHAILVLNGIPDAAEEQLIIDWATSYTQPR